MIVRFFNDYGPDNQPRLLIGLAPDSVEPGEAREAVRVATEEDLSTYAAQYAQYCEQQQQLQPEAAPPAEEHASEEHAGEEYAGEASGEDAAV